jgi:hypothetical protein
MVNVAD